MKAHWLIGVVACGLLLSGCAESKAYRSYSEEVDSWSYGKRFAITWYDWLMSAVDITHVEVGLGECIGIVVQPTKILQTGFLFGDVMKLGWRNRSFGFYREVQKEGGIGWAYYRSRRFEPILGTPSLFDPERRQTLFEDFPIRYNIEEGHWADLGVQVGIVLVEASVQVSPKCALNLCVNTLMLPMNLFLRYPLKWCGMRFPEIDLMEENTPARLQKKYSLTLIPNPKGFPPVEVLNDLWEVPY